MRFRAASAIVLLGMALSGCASVIDGSSERISVATAPVSGARCVLSNGRGHWTVTTPGTVNVERSKHDMDVRCSKPGHPDVKGTIASDMDGWTLVNFLFADLPGLGVDAWTGAINDYSDTNHFSMEQAGGAQQSDDTQQGNYTQQPNTYPSYPDSTAPSDQYSTPSYPAPTQPYTDSTQPDSGSAPPTPGTLPPD